MNDLFTLQTEGPALPASAIAGFWRAADAWAAVLGGDPRARLDVLLVSRALPAPVVAENESVDVEWAGNTGLLEQGAVTELRTGVDPNGAAPDIRISVDAVALARTDPYEIFLHEIGHSLAWNGWGPGGAYQTVWDSLVQDSVAGPQFIGRLAETVTGGPVRVAADHEHMGGLDVMYPSYTGVPFGIGAADLAILVDVGVPLKTMTFAAAPEAPVLPPAAVTVAPIWMA